MRKYDSYKDSGVEWIGEIPSHWEKSRLCYLGEFTSSGIDKKINQEESLVKIINFTDIYKNKNHILDNNIDYMVVSAPENKIKQNLVKKGDLIFLPSSETYEDLGLSALVNEELENTSFSYHVINFRISPDMNHEFKKYLTNNNFVLNQFAREGQGTTRKIIGRNVFRNIKVAIPPIEEQTAIANYLDQKTTQVDDLIAKKERLIQLLEEERTAIINQAVTKGIFPNVPMKDSGIEWLGEIPAHWELWKISHAFKRIGSGTTPESGNPLYHENGTINWLNTGDLNDGEVVSCNKKITEQAMIDYTSLKLFPAGSLVMAMYGATIGKTGIIKFDTTTNQACCVFCEGDIIDLKFLQYWFLAKKENIINLAIGGGQPNISQNILKDIRVSCPSLSEQFSIVQYLEIRTKELDLIVAKAYQEIELLKEYKTALISDVVTGKVDVRNEKLN